MRFAVVLGHWLNDDGTPDDELLERMMITNEMINKLHPDKVILSGGIANEAAGISEAAVMKNVLVDKYHFGEDLFILEDKSTTTRENAKYSGEILINYDVDELIIVSSIDHFTERSYNAFKFFVDNVKNKDVTFMIYTKSR